MKRAPIDASAIEPGYEVVNRDGRAPLVLTCDHAGRAIPAAYSDLGLCAAELRRHIAWDIGAAKVTRRLARHLDAPAVMAVYSRLFIDANRKLGSPESVVRVSDGVEIPGNQNLDPSEAGRRAAIAFWPYHHAVERAIHLGEAQKGVVAYVAVHSFTPQMAGAARPWHLGVLYDRDDRMARPLLANLRGHAGIEVGDNQPYSAAHPPGYGLEAYGTSAGRPHVMIEIRQDLIEDEQGVARWAGVLADALGAVMADPRLFQVRRFA